MLHKDLLYLQWIRPEESFRGVGEDLLSCGIEKLIAACSSLPETPEACPDAAACVG